MKINKLLGIILTLIGILIIIIKSFITTADLHTREEKVVSYLENTSSILTDITRENDEDDYIAILEIPKINLKRGLLDINSEYNDVSYNVAIMETSLMPDIKNSNLILAAHNGNSPVSFFKDLESIGEKDMIYIYYNGYKYIYQIDNYYVVDKTGKVNIHRDKTKNTITLITCKNNTEDKQIVYIGYLINKEIY